MGSESSDEEDEEEMSELEFERNKEHTNED